MKIDAIRPRDSQNATLAIKCDGNCTDTTDTSCGIKLALVEFVALRQLKFEVPNRNDLRILRLAGFDLAATEEFSQPIEIVGIKCRNNIGIALIVIPVIPAAVIPSVITADGHF